MSCSYKVTAAIVGVAGGALLILGGVLGWVVFPAAIRDEIAKNVVLKPDTDAWDAWKKSPVPRYISFWFFNFTNAHTFFEFGVKPVAEEVGPYVFEEIKEKWSIKLSRYEDTVTYLENTTYIFRQDLSPRSEDDKITTVNTLVVGVAAELGNPTKRNKYLVLNEAKKTTPYMTHSVREILFDGCPSHLASTMENELDQSDIPDNVRDGKFAYFNGRNNTDSGMFEMYTGIGDITKYSIIKSWRGESSVHMWTGDACNMINGSDGMQFPPFVTKDTTLRLFNTDLCRSIYATFEKEVEFRGIPGYRFVIPEEVMADPRVNPDNACFCVPRGDCHKAGVMNVKNCYDGAPLAMSAPHFYQGAREYQMAVEGISPHKENHETFIDLDPNTGIAIRAAKRLQINVELFRDWHKTQFRGGLPQFSNIPHVILPVFWLEEAGEIDAEAADTFSSRVVDPQAMLNAVKWALIGVGALLLVCTVAICMKHRGVKKESDIVYENSAL